MSGNGTGSGTGSSASGGGGGGGSVPGNGSSASGGGGGGGSVPGNYLHGKHNFLDFVDKERLGQPDGQLSAPKWCRQFGLWRKAGRIGPAEAYTTLCAFVTPSRIPTLDRLNKYWVTIEQEDLPHQIPAPTDDLWERYLAWILEQLPQYFARSSDAESAELLNRLRGTTFDPKTEHVFQGRPNGCSKDLDGTACESRGSH